MLEYSQTEIYFLQLRNSVVRSRVRFTSVLVGLLSMVAFDKGLAYQRAIEGSDNVKRKIYSRKGKLEIDAPDVGIILNQAYIRTFLIGGGIVYHSSEEWGFGVDFSLADNTDKSERTCIENFFRDPGFQLDAACSEDGSTTLLENVLNEYPDSKANYGPAYVPIRELQNLIFANAIWTPIYGKQLIFMAATSYFDLYFEFGGGIVNSLFYPKQTILKNGKAARGVDEKDATESQAGADLEEGYAYGVEGRPDPESQVNPAINIGIGQKFHFANRVHLRASLRNTTILGTESGFDFLFSLKFGLGFRF